MGLFSYREGKSSQLEIVEDAPTWFRTAFIQQVLVRVLHLDQKNHPFADPSGPEEVMEKMQSPIGVKALIASLALINRTSPPMNYMNDQYCVSALQTQLLSMEWYQFFDAIEVVSKELIEYDAQDRTYLGPVFSNFREQANLCFAKGCIGWRLDGVGKLYRAMDSDVLEAEKSIEASETAKPIRLHFSKARRFLSHRPCDSANAIKESVSALESLARTIAPQAGTLGKAINILRGQGAYPSGILAVAEKLYAFASDEPGVRHGSPDIERVVRSDAEFVYITTLALTQYFIEIRK